MTQTYIGQIDIFLNVRKKNDNIRHIPPRFMTEGSHLSPIPGLKDNINTKMTHKAF